MATKETKTSTSKKSKTLGRELYYFYSLGCAWCKKVEPHIETLNKKGYNIIKLDTGEKDNADAKKELQEKFTFNCGTPLLIDPKSGDKICGYRDLNIVQKLADGEKIPEPPRPKSPPPRPPKVDDNKDVDRWKKEYEQWKNDNKQVKNIPDTEVMLNNLRKQFQLSKQNKANNVVPENITNRISEIENKLDRLMNHLGVK